MSEFQLALAQKEIVEDVLGVKHVVNTSRNAINNFNKKLGKELHVKTTDNPTLTNLIKDTAKMKKANVHYEPNTSLWYKIDGDTLYIRGHEAEGYSERILYTDPKSALNGWSGNTTITKAILEEIIVPISCAKLFCGCTLLLKIENFDNLKITHYCSTLYGAYANLYNLVSINVSQWDVCNVTDMTALFQNCESLVEIKGLENWNTHNVTSMYNMFKSCINITDLTSIKNWNTSSLTSMLGMFNGNNVNTQMKLIKLDLSRWDVSKVTTFRFTFGWCTSLQSIGDLSRWNVRNVTTFAYTFFNCLNLTHVGDLSNWNAPKCTDAAFMFGADHDYKMKFTELKLDNLFKNGVINNVKAIFQNCYDLETLGNLSNWNVSNLKSFRTFFYAGYNDYPKLKFIGDISNWNVDNVTSFESMFTLLMHLTNVGSLKNWNTSNVTTMRQMFNLTIVNGLDMKNWDTSKCTDMYEAFGNFNSYVECGEGISYIKSLCPIHKGTNTHFAFWYNRNLTTIEDSGTISESVNFAYSPLTHDSALVLINALDAENPGTLTLSTETYATLTDEDKAIATSKGWTIAA